MKQPSGQNQLVVYLDFDGVLHHENVRWHPRKGAWLSAPPPHRLFQHADLLAEVLEPYPQVKIVLSTSWVRVYGFSRAAKRLPEPVRNRIIGATFHSHMREDEFLQSSRGMQVWGDVVRRGPLDWLALDDDGLNWPAWCRDKLIRTHEHLGMAESEVLTEFRAKLLRMCTASDERRESGESAN